MITNKNSLKIGIVFGGGGARGLGHVGAIKAFEEAGLKPDFICGTSIGSLVGAVWAAGASAKLLEDQVMAMKSTDLLPHKILPVPSSAKRIEDFVIKVLGEDLTFDELKIPFACVAVDINSAQEVTLKDGPVAKAVSASCAVPGYFVPVEIDGKNYVDGGLLNNIPSNVALENFCDYIIAIDINSARGYGSETIKMFDVLAATIRIMGIASSLKGIAEANYVIKPDLKKYRMMKFQSRDEMIEAGYRAAQEAIPFIRADLAALKTRDKQMKNRVREVKKAVKRDQQAYREGRKKV